MVATGEPAGRIGPGLVILWGIDRHDTWEDAEYCIRKALTSKLFDHADGRSWADSVVSAGRELLVLSQFTLYGTVEKGAKPDFHAAMKTEDARVMFNKIIGEIRKQYSQDNVQTGSFGNYSKIDLEFDGPVTIVIDTATRRAKQAQSVHAKPTAATSTASSSESTPQSQ